MKPDLRRDAIGAALLVVALTGAASADPWQQATRGVPPRLARSKPHPRASGTNRALPSVARRARFVRAWPKLPCRGQPACLAHGG